jgi:HSP20 family protein
MHLPALRSKEEHAMAERERSPFSRDPFFGDLFESLPRVYSRDFLDAFWGGGERARVSPVVDVSEDAAHYVVHAEIPGVKREDVSVELESGALTIRGEKKREERDERRRVVERAFGAFERRFTLPSDADPERVDASFRDGVLTVTIAKSELRKVRSVNVKEA